MLLNPLFDFDFLNKLMQYRQREIFARITLLNQEEFPIKYLEGRITGGSINVDGNSALRRTCNLTMVLENQSEINEFDWTFKSKFSLEIGLKNFINPDYPEIIWFKQGIFILTTCNMSQTTNNYTITINGKDKMCLLNGDISGVIPHSTDFGVEEYLDVKTQEVSYKKILLKDIIKNALTVFGGEKLENIIINDLDEAGFELLEYNYEDYPLYLFKSIEGSLVLDAILGLPEEETSDFPDSYLVYPFINGKWETKPCKVSDISKIKYDTLSNLIDSEVTKVRRYGVSGEDKNIEYTIIQLKYSDLAGYRLTDLTYAGELIANIGETIVSILDKIKNMLGNFEYFYNIDGRFVFQKKSTYISTPWGGVENNSQDFVNAKINDSFPKINLTNGELITSFANNPNLLNVKNDFSVWGSYSSSSGEEVPIHMRYAIDSKPTLYKPIRSLWTRRKETPEEEAPEDYLYYSEWLKNVTKKVNEEEWTYAYFDKFFTTNKNDTENNIVVDWREIIYQMALDYYECGQDENFLKDIAEKNSQYPFGRTGYEQYYVDMQGFWRQLYNPNPEPDYAEINATDVNAMKNWADKIYVQSYHYPVEYKEDKSNFLDENSILLEDLPYDISEIYVGRKITVKDSSGQPFEKLTFYPFIGSQYCHLIKDEIYWYWNNNKYIKTDDPEELNKLSLNDIYVEVDGEKKLFIPYQFQQFVKNFWNGSSCQMWVKAEGKKLFKDLNHWCQVIYKGGKAENNSVIQYLSNWAIKNNYGDLSSDKETLDKIIYIEQYENGDYNTDNWNKSVSEAPGSLYFWFDFLETEGSDLYKYSVKEIGSRPKAINDSNVKSIYYRDVPNVIFIKDITDKAYKKQPGYTYINLPQEYQFLFHISTKGKSAKEKIDELLQEHSYVTEQTNITMIPLYNLAPNTRISVSDKASKVDGEYIVTRFNVPLAYNGTMSLQTTKVVSNIV